MYRTTGMSELEKKRNKAGNGDGKRSFSYDVNKIETRVNDQNECYFYCKGNYRSFNEWNLVPYIGTFLSTFSNVAGNATFCLFQLKYHFDQQPLANV